MGSLAQKKGVRQQSKLVRRASTKKKERGENAMLSEYKETRKNKRKRGDG